MLKNKIFCYVYIQFKSRTGKTIMLIVCDRQKSWVLYKTNSGRNKQISIVL